MHDKTGYRVSQALREILTGKARCHASTETLTGREFITVYDRGGTPLLRITEAEILTPSQDHPGRPK